MKAVQVMRYGGPEVLEMRDIEIPQPGPGEVLVRQSLAGVNFIDIYTRLGAYKKSQTYANAPPFTLGREGAGVIEQTGADVADFELGERVAYCLCPGCYAEYAVVPAWRLARVPDAVELPIATALMLQGGTAHYLSHSLFPLGPEHTCLIHAGAGGVGQLLIQLAKASGARVLTTVGSEAKADVARKRGADLSILYNDVDFAEAVLDVTEGNGVDVVYDSVGQATFERSLRCLKRRGTCALFGGASGQVESVSPLALAEAGSVFLTRPHMADYMSNAREITARANDLFALLLDGKLAVTIDREFPLADAAVAHRTMEGRGTRGKLLLRI